MQGQNIKIQLQKKFKCQKDNALGMLFDSNFEL